MLDERVVFQGVLGAFDIHIFQRMRGILQAKIKDVLRGHPQIMRLRHTEEPVDVGRLAGAHLQGPVNVAVSVGIAVGEHQHRKLLVIGQAPDKPAAGPGGHPAHGNQDALGLLVIPVMDKALEE